MGPIRFLWPHEREQGVVKYNADPCGSAVGVTNRTEFPLSYGVLALVIQEESSKIQVSISYKESPISNDDFTLLIESTRIKDVGQGYVCYSIPDPPRHIKDGTDATLQIKYQTQSGCDETRTFYTCTDIRYISTSMFNARVPCFNVTADDFIIPNRISTTQPGFHPTMNSDVAGSSGTGLSRGAVTGIAIGVLVGVILIVLSYIGYRRYHQRRRLRLHRFL